jgi:hypothetical protein
MKSVIILIAATKFNVLGTSVNCPRQSSCLPTQMEAKIEVQDMLKGFPRYLSNSSLSDRCEDGVEQFAEECGTNAGQAVCGSRKIW